MSVQKTVVSSAAAAAAARDLLGRGGRGQARHELARAGGRGRQRVGRHAEQAGDDVRRQPERHVRHALGMGGGLQLAGQVARPRGGLLGHLGGIQHGHLRRDSRLQPQVGGAVVHPDQVAEDLAGRRADQRPRHRLGGRAHAPGLALQHAGSLRAAPAATHRPRLSSRWNGRPATRLA